MSINSSMPKIKNTGSTGKSNMATVPNKITNEARGTPATPLLVSIRVSAITICCSHDNGCPAACATNTEANDRYKVVPSRLKL